MVRRVGLWLARSVAPMALAHAFCAGPAGAQPGENAPPSDAASLSAWTGSCEASADGASPPAGSDLRALYQKFECHFARGEYHECLPYLERACRLTSSPRCSFNLGAVHHALMHCNLARGHYEQFLDRAPYDEDGAAARAALEEISGACGAGEPRLVALPEATARAPSVEAGIPALPVGGLDASGEPATGVTSEPPQRVVSGAAPLDGVPHTRSAVALPLLGAGAAAAVATVLAALYGQRAEADFDSRRLSTEGRGLSDDRELRAIDRRGRGYNQLAVGFGIASGLLIAGGTTLYLLDLGVEADMAGSDRSATLRFGGGF